MLVKRLTILCELLSTTMPNKILPPSFVTYARDLVRKKKAEFFSYFFHLIINLGCLKYYVI
jgi:hypothetical protein